MLNEPPAVDLIDPSDPDSGTESQFRDPSARTIEADSRTFVRLRGSQVELKPVPPETVLHDARLPDMGGRR